MSKGQGGTIGGRMKVDLRESETLARGTRGVLTCHSDVPGSNPTCKIEACLDTLIISKRSRILKFLHVLI